MNIHSEAFIKLKEEVHAFLFKRRNRFLHTIVYHCTKGQLLSKCPYGVIVLTKIPTIFLRIAVLASKKRLNQKLLKAFYFLIII